MKTIMKTLLAASLLCGAGMIASAPASAQPSGFSFRVGDVGIGYNDGYYDRSHRWHRWERARERDWYRANYARRFHRHDRDNDGIPDRWDLDMDNDGVPNAYDNRPNNPYRR